MVVGVGDLHLPKEKPGINEVFPMFAGGNVSPCSIAQVIRLYQPTLACLARMHDQVVRHGYGDPSSNEFYRIQVAFVKLWDHIRPKSEQLTSDGKVRMVPQLQVRHDWEGGVPQLLLHHQETVLREDV